MKWCFLLGIVSLVYSCQNVLEEEFGNEYISADGELSPVEIVEPFHVDSVQFSTGKILYFIRCEARIEKEQVSVSMQYDANPINRGSKFSKCKISVSDLPREFGEIVTTMDYGVLKLTARGKGTTLRLTGKLIEGH